MPSLKRFTTINSAGESDNVIIATTIDDLCALADNAIIIGRGSNVLIGNVSVPVAINRADSIKLEGETVIAESGATLAAVNAFATRNNLSGLEWSAGIPASIGGALCMNAGAFGKAMADVVSSCTVYRKGKIVTLKREQLKFGYRTCLGLEHNDRVLTVSIALSKSTENSVRENYLKYFRIRQNIQPRGFSAGSVFKNPTGDYAGRLIEDAGLKGFSIGDCFVSEKHANFIINRGSAKVEHIADLVRTIQAVVYDKFNIELTRELRFIGDV